MCFTLNRHKPKVKSLLKRKPIRLGLIRLQIGWGGGVYWSVTVYIAWGCLWNFTSPFRTLHGGGRSWLVVNLVCKKSRFEKTIRGPPDMWGLIEFPRSIHIIPLCPHLMFNFDRVGWKVVHPSEWPFVLFVFLKKFPHKLLKHNYQSGLFN